MKQKKNRLIVTKNLTIKKTRVMHKITTRIWKIMFPRVTPKTRLKNIHFEKLAIKICPQNSYLKKHIEKRHPNCDQKRKVTITNDKRQNKALKVEHQCEQCKKNSSSNYNLKRHTQTHSWNLYLIESFCWCLVTIFSLLIALYYYQILCSCTVLQPFIQTRRGSPFDDRPSTDKLHHFVRKKREKKCDTWHVTHDTWHVTRDTFGGVNILSKF